MKKSTKIVVVYTILAFACAAAIVLFIHPYECFYANVLSSKPDEYIDIIDLPESDPYLEEAIANPSKAIRVDELEKSAYYQMAKSRGTSNVKVGDSYFHINLIVIEVWGWMTLFWFLLASIILAWMILYIIHHRRELGRTI